MGGQKRNLIVFSLLHIHRTKENVNLAGGVITVNFAPITRVPELQRDEYICTVNCHFACSSRETLCCKKGMKLQFRN